MIRELQKAYRVEDAKRERPYKASRIVIEIASWLQRTSYYKDLSLKDAVEGCSRVKLPASARGSIEYLESLRVEADREG